MQKIFIKDFGAIKNAEIEVNKIVVLIGEQASGKSTVAKLIYFFKILGDKVFDRFYSSSETSFKFAEHFVFPVRDEFYNLFGSTRHLRNFEIEYYYDFEANKSIKLTLGKNNELIVNGDKMFEDFKKTNLYSRKTELFKIEEQLLKNLSSREEIALTSDKLSTVQKLSAEINLIFENDLNKFQYIIAGRESTVSYQSTFETYLEKTLMEISEENRKKKDIERSQTVDEILMLDFLKEVKRIRDIFRKLGGSFESIIKHNSEKDGKLGQKSKINQLFLEKANAILKGKYSIDQNGEKIRLANNGDFVFLKDASSGQKESIRILQNILLNILEKEKFFIVIEEPEAHLFPFAQKLLVELLILMTNNMGESQLIITTHSPYVLTVINNLLFAERILQRNPASTERINQIIDKSYTINPIGFSAYSLKSSSKSETIFNRETGVIDQNYLDTVSEILEEDFSELFSIYTEK